MKKAPNNKFKNDGGGLKLLSILMEKIFLENKPNPR
tara:strand:+ start:106 stop:213 length:108 start_codon:yes stop_codon:yes gene_type:complete